MVGMTVSNGNEPTHMFINDIVNFHWIEEQQNTIRTGSNAIWILHPVLWTSVGGDDLWKD